MVMAAHLAVEMKLSQRPQLGRLPLTSVGRFNISWKYFCTSSIPWHRAQRAQTPQNELARDRLTAREFFLSVLSSATTKRDARPYLSRYKPASKKSRDLSRTIESADGLGDKHEEHYNWRLDRSGVNLGGLYTYPTAIEESPVFQQELSSERVSFRHGEPLHLAVVKIHGPQLLDAEILDGVALTLAQLARLGLLSVVVIDCDEFELTTEDSRGFQRAWRDEVVAQANRLASAINNHSKEGARVVEQALSFSPLDSSVPHVVPVRGEIAVQLKSLILHPLGRGIIPVIPPLAYTRRFQMRPAKADDVVGALAREFADLSLPSSELQEDWSAAITEEVKQPLSLDRIIILDPLGGIPSEEGSKGVQLFVNLEQEYQDIRHGLVQAELGHTDAGYAALPRLDRGERLPLSGRSDASSDCRPERITTSSGSDIAATEADAKQPIGRRLASRYVRNLDLIHGTLSLLPPSSSALLTTPLEAAGSAFLPMQSKPTPGVGTRLKRNPLIHNLLTDRPMVSSSLPTGRHHPHTNASTASATFFKRGMPVTIIPDPRVIPWLPPDGRGTALSLHSDPRIDFPRLLHLIEDSFGRPLDVHHYLSRVSGHIAGVIIAGEYEGGAILTWEMPPYDSSRPPVPYLDKFAVLRRSQGSGGVADIVFNAMVRQCFPDGVVWRSRNNNPVNRWYFERAVGTWRLTGSSHWCMFWTGDGIDLGATSAARHEDHMAVPSEKRRRWQDYVDVCSSIEASWADREKPPD